MKKVYFQKTDSSNDLWVIETLQNNLVILSWILLVILLSWICLPITLNSMLPLVLQINKFYGFSHVCLHESNKIQNFRIKECIFGIKDLKSSYWSIPLLLCRHVWLLLWIRFTSPINHSVKIFLFCTRSKLFWEYLLDRYLRNK